MDVWRVCYYNVVCSRYDTHIHTHRVQHLSFILFFYKYVVLRIYNFYLAQKVKDSIVNACLASWTSGLAIQGHRMLFQQLFFSQQ